MKILITKEIQESINKLGNKTARANGLKVYAGLYNKSLIKSKNGLFPVPSNYLESINKRYHRTIKQLLKDGIIDYFKRDIIDPNDIFNTITKKYYNTTMKICMKYRILVDLTNAYEIEVDMDTYKKTKWYDITYKSLEQLGHDNIKITRDEFGRRVHHNLTQTYKEELKNKGYSVIDAKCSQPRLLYLLMKERGVVDVAYNSIFENGRDFYLYVVGKLGLDGSLSGESDRKDAKDLFMFWLNANGYVPNFNFTGLFPVASKFLSKLKSNNYKDSASFFQREEAKIWIDGILSNVNVNFALTVHDSIIVKNKDANDVLDFCKEKYPNIEFELKSL